MCAVCQVRSVRRRRWSRGRRRACSRLRWCRCPSSLWRPRSSRSHSPRGVHGVRPASPRWSSSRSHGRPGTWPPSGTRSSLPNWKAPRCASPGASSTCRWSNRDASASCCASTTIPPTRRRFAMAACDWRGTTTATHNVDSHAQAVDGPSTCACVRRVACATRAAWMPSAMRSRNASSRRATYAAMASSARHPRASTPGASACPRASTRPWRRPRRASCARSRSATRAASTTRTGRSCARPASRTSLRSPVSTSGWSRVSSRLRCRSRVGSCPASRWVARVRSRWRWRQSRVRSCIPPSPVSHCRRSARR